MYALKLNRLSPSRDSKPPRGKILKEGNEEPTVPSDHEEPLFAPGVWNRFFWSVIVPLAIVGILDIALLWVGGTEIHREVWIQISEYSVLFRSQMYQAVIEVAKHVLMPLAIAMFALYLFFMGLPYNPRVRLRGTLAYKAWKTLRRRCRTENEEEVSGRPEKVNR